MVRRAGLSTIRWAPVVALLVAPSCYSLPKAEVIRVIDDFAEDAGPTWNAFEPWTCGLHVDRSQASDAGQDGGLSSNIEAGQAVDCTLGIGTDDTDPAIPPGTITRALVASFDLSTPSSVEVVTRTNPVASGGSGDALAQSMTVNLTGFSQLLFNAKLIPTPPGTAPLPPGTELHVELRCSSTKDPLVDQDISALIAGVTSWKMIALSLSDFTVAAQREACLATVESIAFVVVPGYAPAGTKVSGTLQLDNIRLQ
jgi:hypothetical protein